MLVNIEQSLLVEWECPPGRTRRYNRVVHKPCRSTVDDGVKTEAQVKTQSYPDLKLTVFKIALECGWFMGTFLLCQRIMEQREKYQNLHPHTLYHPILSTPLSIRHSHLHEDMCPSSQFLSLALFPEGGDVLLLAQSFDFSIPHHGYGQWPICVNTLVHLILHCPCPFT